MSDAFIGFETDGPAVAGAVDGAINEIIRSFGKIEGKTLDFGNINPAPLERLQAQLRAVAEQAQRTLAAVDVSQRRAAAPGIFSAATGQAGSIIASQRSTLPLVMQGAPLERAFKDALTGALRVPEITQGIGRGTLGLGPVSASLTASADVGKQIQKDLQKAAGENVYAYDTFTADIKKRNAAESATAAKTSAAAQRAGSVQATAEAADVKRTKAAEAQAARDTAAAQRAGSLQASAEAADARRTKAADAAAQRAGSQQATAERLDAATTRLARERETLARAEAEGWHRVQGGFQSLTNEFYTSTQGGKGLTPAAGVQQIDLQRRLAQSQQGLGPSFFSGLFGNGISTKGPEDLQMGLSNLARTAGQTAKYSLLYQALNLLQTTFRDTLTEAARFSEGVRDLDIAMGQAGPVSQQYIAQLSEISRTAGENPSAAIESAARGVRAFTTPGKSSTDEIQRAGLAVADSSNQIALITGKALTDATGDVVAVASAFGLAATESSKVVDALVTAKALGGDPSQISQGAASMAQVAHEAGLGLQETYNAISLISARVDESGSAAATRLSRMLAILGGTTGRNIIDKINGANIPGASIIDPTANAADQLKGVAAAYAKAGAAGNTQLQGLIRSAFGAANQRETTVLFENADKIFGAKTTVGAGEEQFKQRMNTLDGLLKLLAGDWTNFQIQVVNTDLFAPFGVMLKGLEVLLHTLDRFLELWNQITTAVGPEWAKPVTTMVIELGLLARMLPSIIGQMGALGTLGARFTGITAAREAMALGAVSRSPLSMPTAWRVPAPALASFDAQAAPVTSVEGMARGAGTGIKNAGVGVKNFATGYGPLLLAASIIGLYSAVTSDVEEIQQIRGGLFDSLKKAAAAGDLQGASDSLSGASTALRAGGGFVGVFTASERATAAAQADGMSKLFSGYAQEADARQRLNAGLASTTAIGNLTTTSVDDFNTTLKSLQDQGQSAGSTMKLLSVAIAELLVPSSRKIDAAKVAAGVALAAAAAGDQLNTADGLPGRRGIGHVNYDLPVDRAGNTVDKDTLARLLGDPKRIGAVKDAIQAGIDANGGKALDDNTTQKIAISAADAFVKGMDLGPEATKAIRSRYIQFIFKQISDQGAIAATGPVANDAALNNMQKQIGFAQSQAGLQSPTQAIATYRQLVTDVTTLRSRAADPNTPELIVQENQAKDLLLQARIKDALALIKATEATSTVKGLAQSKRLFQQLALQALADKNSNALQTLIDGASQAEYQAVLAVIDSAIAVQDKAYQALRGATYGPIALSPAYLDLLANKSALQAARARAAITKDSPGFGLGSLSSKANKETATDIANAMRSALVAGSNDPLAADAVAVTNARASLAQESAKGRNTVAYWNAVGAFNSAKKTYADALRQQILSVANIKDKLGIDLTDPVASAAEALREAQRKLRSDKGQSTTTLLQDQLDVRAAQTSVESTKFSQRLSDMQTADQLGRISHQAYLRYLNNEHDRLSAIKNRTRQQIDELNSIDTALKAAASSLSGQFNLGDIKVPTVYETRRAMAAGLGGAAASTSNVVININGADTGMFQQMLNTYVGPVRSGSVTVTSRRT